MHLDLDLATDESALPQACGLRSARPSSHSHCHYDYVAQRQHVQGPNKSAPRANQKPNASAALSL
eukprot:scaffold9423_cov132-Isochrysis_galbana.AAC.6